jgi:predicted nuclease of predicted toxin-antitoxin system
VRFLIDEMFGAEVAICLVEAGHDGVHVADLGLCGATDRDVVTRAATEDRVVVTENAADFLPLLDEMIAAGDTVPAVVIALKRSLPRRAGALHHAQVGRLVQWADANPEPYRHAHWLG